MKRIKFDKTREFTIYKVDTYSKGNKPYADGTFFEHSASYLYYLDNKRKRVYEQSKIEFRNRTHFYVSTTKHRSIKSMERKFNEDYKKLPNIFSEFKVTITKMAIL